MFSGLTNQVTSWMNKGDVQEEEVPVNPTTNDNPELSIDTTQQQQQLVDEELPVATGEDGDKKQSPTKSGGLFSGVKSQMSGWLGNASMPSMPAMPAMPSMPSIPGLRKTQNNTVDGGDGIANDGLTSPDKLNQTLISGDIERTNDEDDKSRYISATEGADSGPGSATGTPTEEQAGQIGNVTTKVTQGAKTFGSFLYSAVNKAGAKIKKTVEENNILGEFNKEQEAFMKNQSSKTDAAVPPWVGHNNEDKIKEEILSLSADRRNFVRAPPAGVDFQFDYDVTYSIALTMMTEDPALEKMRFELVPKIITEENFWRNYFYRVSLICQAGELGTLGEGSQMGLGSSEDGDVTDKCDKTKTNLIKSNESEFISDNYKATEKDLEEVKAGMRKLGIDSLAKQAIENDEQWEKDLEAELQDYEVVNDNQNPNWEKDVDDLLGDDLK